MRTQHSPSDTGAVQEHPTSESWSPAVAFMTRLGVWRVVIGSGIVFIVFAGVLFMSSASFSIPTVEDACGASPLDVRFYSSGAEVDRFLDDCGPAGRDAYRNLQVADLVYPAVFALFMGSTLALALTHLFHRRPRVVGLAVLALVAGGFDYLENLFAWRALTAFPDSVATNSVLGLASAAKTVTSWLVGVLLIAVIVAVGVGALRRRIGGAPRSRRAAVPPHLD